MHSTCILQSFLKYGINLEELWQFIRAMINCEKIVLNISGLEVVTPVELYGTEARSRSNTRSPSVNTTLSSLLFGTHRSVSNTTLQVYTD